MCQMVACYQREWHGALDAAACALDDAKKRALTWFFVEAEEDDGTNPSMIARLSAAGKSAGHQLCQRFQLAAASSKKCNGTGD